MLKYDRLQVRSYTTGPALKAAVDQALGQRATELAHDPSANHLCLCATA